MNAVSPKPLRASTRVDASWTPSRPGKRVTRLLLNLGAALHRSGAPAHRLESAMTEVATALGVEARFFSTPTLLLATFGELGQQRTQVLRVEPGDIDLSRVVALDRIAAQVAHGELSPRAALAAVEAPHTPPWRPATVTLAMAAASASAAPLLGGGPTEAVVAGLAALCIALLPSLLGNHPARRNLLPGLSGFLVAFVAGRVAAHVPLQATVATVAGLIVLVPGLTLTVAVSELATRHLASGSARLFDGLSTLMQLAFGSLLGATLAHSLGQALPAGPAAVTQPMVWACVTLAGLSFTALFQAHGRHAPVVTGAALLGWGALQAAHATFGPEVAVFVASGVVGTAGNALARWRKLPATVVLVPGLILLVPGATGLASIQQLLAEQTLAGVGAGFRGALLCCALAAGLLVAHAVVPPRRAL